MDLGATGTSTSLTTSRVGVRPGPPNTTNGPIFGKPTFPEDEGLFLGCTFALPEDFLFDEDSGSPRPEPSRKNSTATITTAPTVRKTMIAVSRMARGTL